MFYNMNDIPPNSLVSLACIGRNETKAQFSFNNVQGLRLSKEAQLKYLLANSKIDCFAVAESKCDDDHLIV